MRWSTRNRACAVLCAVGSIAASSRSYADSQVVPLSKTAAGVNLRLVHPTLGVVDDWLSEVLLTSSVIQPTATLTYRVSKKLDQVGGYGEIVGDTTQYSPSVSDHDTTQQVVIDYSHLSPTTPDDIGHVVVKIARSSIPPDHYTGSLYIRNGSDDPVITIPVAISISCGPLLPCLTIIIGILLGWLVKYMQATGNATADQETQIERLEKLVSSNQADSDIIAPMIANLRIWLSEGRLTDVTAEFTAIEKRFDILRAISNLEPTIPPGDAGNDARQRIDQIRRQVILKQDSDAAANLAQLEKTLGSIFPPPPVSPGLGAQKHLYANVKSDNTLAKSSFKDLMALVVVRQLLYWVLLVALWVAGIYAIYVHNPSFGANPLPDYFGALAWGLGSDIASRNLGSLPAVSRT